MNCKCCGYPLAACHPQCPVCGTPSPRIPAALPAPGKARNRLPYLLLGLMAILGLLLYWLIPMDASPSAAEESPAATISPESKTLFQKDCFLLENGELYFDESRYLANPILVVPAAIDGNPVTAIGAECFRDLQGVTTVILPSSITSVGDFAFAGCTDLRGACIPNGVTDIGTGAFRDCPNLEAVYLPTGLARLGEGAFDECLMLTFIFYNGYWDQWQSLYPDTITPYTWVICWDGEYRHVGKTP